jgi:hypothetical protein
MGIVICFMPAGFVLLCAIHAGAFAHAWASRDFVDEPEALKRKQDEDYVL